MFKRLATLLLGIGLIGLGVLLFTAPGGSAVMQWLTKAWPAFLILAGLVRVFGYLVDRHPRSPVGGMMITGIGGVLLAANLRGDRSLLLMFGQYWFFMLLALIVGRVLWQYTHRIEDGKRPRAFSPGAIFVMVLLVSSGLASNYLAKNQQHLQGVQFKLGQLGFWGSRFTVEDEPPLQFSFFHDGRLLVSDFKGNVEISTLEGSLPTARLVQHIRANNQEEANQVAQHIRLQITQAGKNMQFAAVAENVLADFTSTLILTLPPTPFSGVELSNITGDVKLTGLRGNHAIRNGKGLEVRNNSGDVKVENPQGSVELVTVQGNVTVSDSIREVSLGEIRGSMIVSATNGSITIAESVGAVKLRAQNARIEIQNLSGDAKQANQTLVAIENTSNSRINLSEIQGNVAVNAERSRIEAENITGNLAVKTSSERVQVNRVSGALKVNAENSIVAVEEVSGAAEIETTEDVTIQGFRGSLNVMTSSGAITLATDEKLAGNVKATTERGRIRISLPEDSGFKFDAGSERGRIRLRGFEAASSQNRQRQLAFEHNAAANSPTVVLRSERGDIELQSSGLALASRENSKEE
ncbi:MAG: DUF4097 family beta strand repeat-containing protein [Acidobacteriota bacterium]|nr:DUF4097 family beta strand repeat-containing protein [Acidobacteriota bacterium]